MTQLIDQLPSEPASDVALRRRPELRWLFGLELAVMTASQLWFVVLTWLLVERAGGGGTVGLVLMAGALPRAALMLVGGAVTDRVRPATVLHLATATITGLLLVATVVEAGPGLTVWHLLVLAAAIGSTDAFVWPAVSALIPRLVPAHRLDAANAAVQVCDQVTQIAGPALGAALLATGGATAALGADAAVAGLALLAAVGLSRRRRHGTPGHRAGASPLDAPAGVCAEARAADGRHASDGAAGAGLGRAVLDGLRFARGHAEVRTGVLGAAGLSLVTVGPISVGGTLLAAERFGGPGALGVLLGAFGVGSLVGVLAAGARRTPMDSRAVLVATFASLGVGLAVIGAAPALWIAAVAAALSAVVAGAAGVVVMSAVQRATPPAMLGRVASLVGFAFVALDPVSQGLAGLGVRAGAGPLLVAAGVVSVLFAVLVARTGSRTTAAAADPTGAESTGTDPTPANPTPADPTPAHPTPANPR